MDIQEIPSNQYTVGFVVVYDEGVPFAPVLLLAAAAVLACAALLVVRRHAIRLGLALIAFTGPVVVTVAVSAIWVLDYPWVAYGRWSEPGPGLWLTVASAVFALLASIDSLIRLARR